MIMSFKIRFQLSLMMFLEFFVWGAWLVTLGTYLNKIGFSGTDIGNAYSTYSIAAIVSPFFIGMIADRFFSAQRVMGVMHLAGGVVMYFLAQVTSPVIFFWTLFLYSLLYMPTLALVNSISFNQMKDPSKEFPFIRVLGTIGWIVAGLVIGFLKVEDRNIPILIASGMSIVLGIYSFFLPNTPPKGAGKKTTFGDILGIKALKLLKDRSFLVFMISALLVCIPLAFYYNFTNLFLNESQVVNAAGKMTMGQMSETIFMFIMPLLFARLGVKKMLLIGMLAWVARYLLFAFGNSGPLVWMFYTGILLHGICYDFFFVTGQIYVDNTAPKEIQSNAQGFFTFVSYGAGMVIGSQISGYIVEAYKSGETHSWTPIWIIPCIMAFVVVVFFGIFFKDKPLVQKEN